MGDLPADLNSATVRGDIVSTIPIITDEQAC
jgi:hypothetical protein